MNKQALLPTGNSAWKCGLLVGFLLLAHAPSTAHGQQLVAGDTIRVRASQSTGRGRGWTEGSVVRLASDTLWYQASGTVLPISVDGTQIQRPAFRNHRWSGLAIGAAAGGAIGASVALAYSEPLENLSRSCSILSFVCPGELGDALVPANSRSKKTATGAVGGALIGGGLGYLFGKALGRWETVELDQVMIGDGNLAVSLSIRR